MSTDYKIEKKEGAYVNVNVKIPYSEFKKEYESLLEREAKKVDAKGFRKGKVPVEMLDEQLKHMLRLEALEKIAPKHLTQIIETEKIELIAPPEYTDLPDLTKEEDLELKIKFTTSPEFKLGDIKKIKVKQESANVKKEEIEDTITEMFNKSVIEDKGQKPDDNWAKKTAELYKLENVKDLNGLKDEIKGLLKKEKERIVQQNAQHEVMQEAIKISKIEVPKEAVDFEAREREKSFLDELKNANMSLDDFCKNNNTNIETLREMWAKDAQEALNSDALLKLYGKSKKIQVSDQELEEGIANIKQSRGEEIPEDVENDPMWRNNIRNVVLKQKAYKQLMDEALETQKDKSTKKEKKTEKKESKKTKKEGSKDVKKKNSSKKKK